MHVKLAMYRQILNYFSLHHSAIVGGRFSYKYANTYAHTNAYTSKHTYKQTNNTILYVHGTCKT